jgi:hypothetical protein
MENREVTFKKIPLKILIDILQDAWETGADYVDIVGIADVVQDEIAIVVKEEYVTEEDDNEYEVDRSDKNLTDDELNQLM